MTEPNMPQWLQPVVPNLLSNTRGANTGADALAFKARYSNPLASGDAAGQMRLTATRTSSAAVPSYAPNVVWDTGWLGAPTTNAMPAARYSFGCAQYGDRVYITGGIDGSGSVRGEVWSAPTGGGSIGIWRQEKPMAVRPAVNSGGAILIGRHGHGCTAANFGGAAVNTTDPNQKGQGGTPWLIIYGGFQAVGQFPGDTNASATMIAAPILGNGVLGEWITISYAGWGALAWTNLLAVPNQYATTALILSGGVSVNGGIATSSSWATIVRNAPATAQAGSDWDAPQGWWKPLTTTGAPATAGHTMAYDWANSSLLWFKGCNNQVSGSNQFGFYYSGFGVDVSTWNYSNLGTSWGAGSAADGSTAQNNAALAYFGAQSAGGTGGSPTSQVYLFGGTSSVSNAGDTSTPQNLVSYTTLTWAAGGVPTASAWTHSATTIPTAVTGCRAFIHEHGLNQGQLYGYPPWCDPNKVYVSLLGGASGVGAVVTSARTTSLPAIAGSGGYTTSGGNISAWQSGIGAGLGNSDLGTGGSIAASTDPLAPAGSQDVTINYGVITTSGGLSDGDIVQLAIQFIDQHAGDPSPTAYTNVRIGQPPTIGSVLPSGTVSNAQPTASFTYASGAGGSGEYSWRLQIKQAGTTLYDTGTRYDNANTVLPTIAPLLVAGTTYSEVITVVAGDQPYPGSSVSATSTTSFSTSAFSAQAAPTALLASVSAMGAYITLSWAAASGASYYRVYYRRTGSSVWLLLADNVSGTSYVAMDNIALNASYDFAVSAVNSTPIESALSSPSVAGTIPVGNFSAFLHIAGAGTIYGIPLQVQGSPTVAKNRTASSQIGFGQGAPIARYTAADYHTIQANALLLDSTPGMLSSLSQIIDQVEAGGLCFWRDALGGMLTVTFDSQQGVSILPPFYRQVQLKLTEAPNTVGPYVAIGSAQGYLTLDRASKPPLALNERLI